VADNQIRLDIRARSQGLEDCVRVPNLVFERAATKVRLRRGTPSRTVLNLFYASRNSGRLLRDKRAAKSMILDQMPGDVPELSREILMHE